MSPWPPPCSSMLVTASEMQRMVRWRLMSSTPACVRTSSTVARARCSSAVSGIVERDDRPSPAGLVRELLRVEDAELAAGDGRGEVVEDLHEAAPVVAVVPLPAVGADAEDVAVVALGHEAELVGDEVVRLRHRVAHEGLVRERFLRVGDEVLLGEVGLERADDGLDAVRAGPVAVHLQRSRGGTRLIGHPR